MEKIKVTDIFSETFEDAIEEQYRLIIADAKVAAEIVRLKASESEVKENIAAFTAFYEDQAYCSKCPGLGECAKGQRHYQVRLYRNGKFIERTFEPCPLLAARMERDRRYFVSDFPEEWKESRLVDLDDRQARAALIAEAVKLIRKQSTRWLYITGSHRTGKSFVMVTIVNELLEAGYGQAAIIAASTYFKAMLDAAITDKPRFKLLFDRLSTIDVLAVDELGNEFKTDYLRDQIVYPLLLQRAQNKKITLFTSDFRINEIGTLYGNTDAGKIRSRQLVRLLNDYCQKELEIGTLGGLY